MNKENLEVLNVNLKYIAVFPAMTKTGNNGRGPEGSNVILSCEALKWFWVYLSKFRKYNTYLEELTIFYMQMGSLSGKYNFLDIAIADN